MRGRDKACLWRDADVGGLAVAGRQSGGGYRELQDAAVVGARQVNIDLIAAGGDRGLSKEFRGVVLCALRRLLCQVHAGELHAASYPSVGCADGEMRNNKHPRATERP